MFLFEKYLSCIEFSVSYLLYNFLNQYQNSIGISRISLRHKLSTNSFYSNSTPFHISTKCIFFLPHCFFFLSFTTSIRACAPTNITAREKERKRARQRAPRNLKVFLCRKQKPLLARVLLILKFVLTISLFLSHLHTHVRTHIRQLSHSLVLLYIYISTRGSATSRNEAIIRRQPCVP